MLPPPHPDSGFAERNPRRTLPDVAMKSEFLLLLFVTHLPYFAWRYRRTQELRFAAATLTFSLLVLAYTVRVFAPELIWSDRPLHEPLRYVALASAIVSIGLLLRHVALGRGSHL